MSKEAKAYHHKWISDEKDLRDRYQVMQDYANQEVEKALRMCNCKMPEKRIKVSENGTSAYCEKCLREVKNQQRTNKGLKP